MTVYDVIVLGAGGVGSAATYHLARRGARVLALDRFPAGHDRGSSHGETRIIRQAYFEHPDYVPLLLRAYELWAELEQQTDERLFHQVGLLQAGPADGVVVPGVLRSAKQHGLSVDEFDSTESMRRFPGFRIPPDLKVVFEPKAGYLRVEQCVRTHLAAAARLGAELQLDATIQTWTTDAEGYRVETSRGSYFAKQLVVTAGPWAVSLLNGIRVPMRVLRKHLHWFDVNDHHLHLDGGCPTFLFELPHGVFYGFPRIDDYGIKVAEHSGGTEVVNPLDDDRSPEPLDQQRVRDFLASWIPGAALQPKRHAVCFYTMTPDEHFLVDRHPEYPGVVFTAGLSGHGFKFTSVLGQIMADMTLDKRTALPIEFLNAGRPMPTSTSHAT